jgi:hypothetical protein
VRAWGYDPDQLLAQVDGGDRAGTPSAPKKPKLNSFTLQRKVMLALKKDIEHRPHGKVIQRVRYYCNVLLRDS